MLSVIAMIGKIILITLLSLLGVLIALLLMVLFVPARYKGMGSFDKDLKPNFTCDIRVSWLLHILSFRFWSIDSEKNMTIRILGIPHSFFFKILKRRKEKVAENSQEKKQKSKQQNILELEKKDESKSQQEDSVMITETEQFESESQEHIESEIKNKENETTTKTKTNFVGLIKEIKNKIKDLISKIKSIIMDGKKLKRKLEHYYRVLTSDVCKEAFKTCKSRLIKLIKHILPKKAKCNVFFGMDDPAVTGNILAIHGILYSVLGDIIILNPSFEEIVLKGDFNFKGKIRIGTVLYQVIRVLLDENCKRFYKIVKKEIKNGR